jgi:hypothetical protein
VHEVLREHAALDVAVVAAADAQDGLVGAGVELAGHFGRRALVALSSSCSLACSATALTLGFGHGVQVQADAVGDGAQRFASMKPRRRAMTASATWCLRASSASVSPVMVVGVSPPV